MWVVDEVRLALEKGYRILEIYEVYEYQVTQLNPDTGEGGYFVDYINTILKLQRRLVVAPVGSTVPKTRSHMWNGFGRMKWYD